MGSSTDDDQPVRTNDRFERRQAAVHEFYQSIPPDRKTAATMDIRTTPEPARMRGQQARHDPIPHGAPQPEPVVGGRPWAALPDPLQATGERDSA